MKTPQSNHVPAATRKEAAPKPVQWRRVCGPLPLPLWEDLVARQQSFEEERLGHHILALSIDAGQACTLSALSGIVDCLAESAADVRKDLADAARHGDGFAPYAEDLRELRDLEHRVVRVMQKVAAQPAECRGFTCGGKNAPVTKDATGNRMCVDCATASNGLLTAMGNGIAAAMRDAEEASS